ncbi:MAG: hypothetical protein IJV41_07065 [Oscillospiraceae bacterium]|nr:hypothetical protein [Oscillospiraceae bacterium]
MFDITDPFGTARIKSLEYEMKVKTCDMQGQIDYYRERALESSHVASYLAGLLENQYKDLQESRKAYKELGQMFTAGEEARKALGEKHREVNNQLAALDRRFKELCENYDQLAERCAAKERELEELYAEHEALVRELRDGQRPAEEAGEPEQEALSA